MYGGRSGQAMPLLVTALLGGIAGGFATRLLDGGGRMFSLGHVRPYTEVVERGSTRDIFHNARHPYTRKLLACDPARLSQREARLPTIPGTLPDLRNRPQGCVFQARCEFADETCSAMPPDVAVGEAHAARCWHLDEIAGAIA